MDELRLKAATMQNKKLTSGYRIISIRHKELMFRMGRKEETMKNAAYCLWILAGALSIFCANSLPAGAQEKSGTGIDPAPFGRTTQGTEMHLYSLTNKHGLKATVTNFGATLVSLVTPDRQGKMADIVLGYDNVSGYEKGKAYFGGSIGRYGNRIAGGRFSVNGKTYQLALNDGANHLHGGIKGFNHVVWNARRLSNHSVEFRYTSKDGEEGYPGTLAVSVTYTLTDNDEVRIDYTAKEGQEKGTIVNLTNHSYFNLTGNPQNTIVNHEIALFASRFTPIDAGFIPTGELREVKGTPFDFTTATPIGSRIGQPDEQLRFGRGYDHNWVIDRQAAGLVKAAEVFDPSSGRLMEVLTTEPGIQFYSGNFLDGTEKGKGGQVYAFRSGLCLETQHYPDSPNKPSFPTTTLKAGQTYSSTTLYRFSAR
jgi:aldose 1-epimerase